LNEPLLGVIGLLWVANLAIVAVAVLQARDRRGAEVDAAARSRAAANARTADVPVHERAARPAVTGSNDRAGFVQGDSFAGTAAAIEAFVAGIDRPAGGAVAGGVVVPGTISAHGVPGPGSAIGGAPSRGSREPTAAATEPAMLPDDDAGDQPSGSVAWERIVREESARIGRFRRPATVVFGEVPDLDTLAERLGPVAADRVAQEAARLVRAEARASDRLAWLGPASFAVLLVETRELDAGSYVGRIRATVDGWFASAGLSIHLRVGWAGSDDDHDLASVAAIARERMHAVGRAAEPPDQEVGRQPARRPNGARALD
jgi:GGDEF domain-containing protein